MKLSHTLFAVLLLFQTSLIAQNTVTGSTKDDQGEVLSFVTVFIENTSFGTTSDLDGNYTLTFDGDAKTMITFSYVGYKTKSLVFNNQSTIDIILESDDKLLEEIIVVGYGTQKKSDVVGAVSVISVEDANVLPSSNIAEMLRGKSAGVQISMDDARPGGSSKILLRGKNSLLGENDPLFVIDGVPSEDLNGINSEDIKSIEILKDASAQAIYGARASNGVVLVTTKRGENGSPLKVSYHGFSGQQTITKNFDLYNSDEWYNLKREAHRTDNPNNEYEADDFVFTPLQLEVHDAGKSVNWEDLLFTKASTQKHSISLSGGGNKTAIYSSFDYYDQKGLIPGSRYKRGTARLNMDYKATDRLKIGANLYLLTDKQDRESKSLKHIVLPPLARAYDSDGNVERYPTGDLAVTSPLWNVNQSTDERKSNEFKFTFFANFDLYKNLTYKFNSSVRRKNRNDGSYLTSLHSSGASSNGKASIFNELKEEYLIENIINYKKDINSRFNFDATLLQSVNERKFINTKTQASNFANDFLGYHGIFSASNIDPVEHKGEKRRILSYMARTRFYLSDKYILTLTGRADGSSVFAVGNKWGFFPSAAVGWKIHLEPFMKNLNFVNELKMRASYGSIGNEAIKPYQTLGLADVENYIFDGVTYGGYQPGASLPNPNLKWETSTTFNIGLDFGIFKNLFVGNFEYYNTKTRDLLVDRTTPGGTGYTKIISNIGRVRNSGFELGLTTNLIKKKNIEWTLFTSFSKNKNEILELFGEKDENGELLDDISRTRFIGESIDVIYNYEFDGIFQTQAEIENSAQPNALPGSIRVIDKNGDGEITTDDRVIYNKTPDWFGSLSSRFKFRGFELFADLYMVQGGYKTNNWLADYNKGGTLQGVLNGIKVDYWTPENHSERWPRPKRSLADRYIWSSAIQEASFVRLRTVSLAYHLPKKWLSKIKISSCSIYGTATNIFTKTKFKGYSPETSADKFPEGKSIVFGIKIST